MSVIMQYYNPHDSEYHKLLDFILTTGTTKTDRTGTGTKSVFGYQMRFDLSDGSIPLLTTKKMHSKSIIHELLWFLRGSVDVTELEAEGVRIWSEWKQPDGTIGKGYGYMWRQFPTLIVRDDGSYGLEKIDQIVNLVNQIKATPDSRRLIVTAWHPGHTLDTSLPPCHMLYQCYVADGKLSLRLDQRSADFLLGVPFNIAQYGILLHMLAQVCDLQPGELIWQGGDVHLYLNHIEQAQLQLTRTSYSAPKLVLNAGITDIFDFKYEDFAIDGYTSHPLIKASVAV